MAKECREQLLILDAKVLDPSASRIRTSTKLTDALGWTIQ